MGLGILLLLTAAGAVHSTWNLLAKRSLDSQAFLWLALVCAAGLFAVPFALLYAPFPTQGWLIIAFSGALEAVYYLLLGSAYSAGDLSVVYPLSRGSAPIFVLVFAVAALGEHVTLLGAAGILLTVAGVYTLHLRSLARRDLLAPLLALRQAASRLALLTGLVIAAYSVVDKIGVRYVNPFLYIYLVFGAALLFLTPYMLVVKRKALAKEWRARSASIVAASAMFVVSYLLVLFALRGAQVSYVTAIRGIAVVFAALMGTLLLREPFPRMKFCGSLLIFLGIACIELAG